MSRSKTLIHSVVLFFLSAVLVCGSLAAFEEEFQDFSEKTEACIEAGYACSSTVVSNVRMDQTGEFLAILKSVRLVQIIKILLVTLLLCLLYKGPSKKLLVISLTERQYFIDDLKIDLLSSRAHPPTC